MTEPNHTHDWEVVEKVIRLHNYRAEDGEIKAIDMTARDTLKQRKCKTCPKVETYDMQRTKLL
jgi:hypothetical protein